MEQQPLDWWQVIERATVRELSALRASGKIAATDAERMAREDETAPPLSAIDARRVERDREIAHHRSLGEKDRERPPRCTGHRLCMCARCSAETLIGEEDRECLG
jgi:hypothetical protein